MRAIAFGSVGDRGAMEDSFHAAVAADLTLGDEPSAKAPAVREMHDMLRARLQERL